ncbi:hypothetical protein OROHE_021595 [Orobanche hederae]
MVEKMRIYIGGLGSSVQEDDLKKTFTSPQLGTVQSVEIIRSKGRSFGYLEYVPASEKGLAKLFSTYNGCMWKGGRLKLDKASEHYISRLGREWTEDAELENKLSIQNVDVNESLQLLQKPKNDQDIHKLQLNIFFPKLRRIKPIPLEGSGKHKYSFQRVEIPPLPIHFCDCEEHCVPSDSAKINIAGHHERRNIAAHHETRNIAAHHETRNIASHPETDPYRVNEAELNMMKSILNKFLEDEDTSKRVPNETELTEDINKDATCADNLQVDDSGEEEASDEDNLVINIVGQPSKRVASFEDWGQKATATHQDSLVREPKSFGRTVVKIHGSNGQKLPDNKRKQSTHENHTNDVIMPSKKKSRKGGPHDITKNPVFETTETKYSSVQSRKSSWRDLVIEKQSTGFHISDISGGQNPDTEPKPRSDRPYPAPCPNKNVDQEDQSSQDKELSKLSDAHSSKPSASKDKSAARGPSWLQKSSWLELIGDTNNNAFSLSQILPGLTFEKQEAQQFGKNHFSNSTSNSEDKKSEIKGIGEYREAEEDIHATLGNKNVDVIVKEQSRAGSEREQPSLVSKQTDTLQCNRVVPDIVISETCPFMKSDASVKEWMKAKAALGGFLKKKRKGKVRG